MRVGAAAQSAGKAKARGSAKATPVHPNVPAAAAPAISAPVRSPSRIERGDRTGEPEEPHVGERPEIA